MKLARCLTGLSLVACGTDPVVDSRLTAANEYSVLGVARLKPEGGPVESLRSFRWALRGVQTVASTAVIELTSPPLSPTSLEGTFDSEEDLLTFKDFSAAVTSSIAATVVGMGMKLSDGKPSDGVGDEVSGYVEGAQGRLAFDGSFLAISPGENRPTPIDESKLSAEVIELGSIRVRGAAGTLSGPVGVQFFRFTRASRNPELTNARGNADGSFEISLEGLSGDIVLVRASAAGNVSDAAAVAVP